VSEAGVVRSRLIEIAWRQKLSSATLERPVDSHGATLACPHCKKQFAPAVDATQPPRLQGAKCPHCKLFVPERVVSARLAR